MGCWNGTCALSNLSINYNDKAVAILLVESDPRNWDHPLGGGFCGTQKDCHPLAFPIRGRYDEGGALDEIRGDDTTEAFVKWVKESGKVSVVDDRGREHSLKDCESILNAIERGVVRIEMNGKQKAVGLMLIHEHIYDSVLKFARENEETRSSFERLSVHAGRECLQAISMARMLRKYGGGSECMKEYLDKFPEGEEGAVKEVSFEQVMRMPEEIRRAFIRRFTYTQGDEWQSLGLVSKDMTKNEDIFYLYLAIDMMRKRYTIQGGAGSQNSNSDFIANLHEATKHVMDRRERWENEELDEEEE